MASSPSSAPHPVDQVPPFGKLTILGIQHVLAFYAGAVVVPIFIASQLGAAGWGADEGLDAICVSWTYIQMLKGPLHSL